jgi:acetylglutamate kinase
MNSTQNVITKLLSNIGSRKEVEQYLRYYATPGAPKLAVIKVSGKVLAASLDELAASLTFLQKVGLLPVVVHGGRPQLDRALAIAGFDAPPVDGLRPMTPAVLEVARRVFHEVNHTLVEALEALGTRARPFTSGVFETSVTASSGLGLVGEIARVHDAPLVSAARSGHVPVVTPLGETTGGQIVVVPAHLAARAMAHSMRPHKIVYLTERGGLVDAAGGVRSAVNLAEDYDENEPSLPEDSRRRLGEIAAMLHELPPSSSVSITSPEHLAKELFTHGGAGTLVRLGERVRRYSSFADIDISRLRALIEECFGRRLHPTYFETKEPHAVYLTDSYRAAAILTLEDAVPYLDKFAVTPEAQGEGLGGSIWQRFRRDHTRLFWRARASNPINSWYAQVADGLYKSDPWWVFWCGMTDFAEIQQCVERALSMAATLTELDSVPPPPPVPP